jgi:iron(III) transport system substrate-binding protein
MNKHLMKLAVLALPIFCANATTLAATTATSPASEAALYQGSDRQERLVAAAQKEGEVYIYHSTPLEDLSPITTAFTKKYGIKVKLWRSGSEQITQRVVTEARGGRFDADVVQSPAPTLEALHREQLLQQVISPYQKDLIPAAVPAHKEWVGAFVNVFVAGYYTGKIKKDDLPKSYEDLRDPKWKGMLGIEADNSPWLATVIDKIGAQKGEKLFDDIGATNGMSLRKGHTLLANLIASGEVPLGLTAPLYKVKQLKAKGAPIDWFVLQPFIGQFSSIGVLKKAPHPNAAVLFYDFMLNEGQPLLAARQQTTTSKALVTNEEMPGTFIDSALSLDKDEQWTKMFEKAFGHADN